MLDLSVLPQIHHVSPAGSGTPHRTELARQAAALFQNISAQYRRHQFWSHLTGRSHQLLDLAEMESACRIKDRFFGGHYAVPISQIRGSEGRSQDFDTVFRPSKTHNAGRWIQIAMLHLQGEQLPPVELIQIGDLYFVRDGHHRISVARVLGQKYIDACVTVWQVTGPLPWQQPTLAHQLNNAWA